MSESFFFFFFFKSVRKFTEGALWALEKLTLVRSLKAKCHQIPAIGQKNSLRSAKFFTFHRLCPRSGRDSCLLRAGGTGLFPRTLVPRRIGSRGELGSREEVARLACPWARLKSRPSAPNEVPPPLLSPHPPKKSANTGVEVRNPGFPGGMKSRFPSPSCAQVPSRASSATQELLVAGRGPLPACIDCAEDGALVSCSPSCPPWL